MTSVSVEQIPVFKPLIEQEEFDAAEEALRLGWLGMGGYVGQFEAALLEFIEAEDREVVALSTGHAALHLGLIAAGVGPGDEVITPSFNNIADFQAILACGAEPVFCDIDDRTLGIDLDKVEEMITPRTKAMIVMDYFCHVCDHDRVAELADKHKLRVIHDAAHSFGSRYKGRMIGSFSDMTMFSFDPVKTITCIDGGALVVRQSEDVQQIRERRLVGMGQPSKVMYQNQRAWTYDCRHLGFRYHMANLHARLGLAQLERIDGISETRRRACWYYSTHLADLDEVRTPEANWDEVTPFLYYIRVPADRRDALRQHMFDQGVDNGIHWQPGHWFSLFKGCLHGGLSVTDRVGNEILSLPLHSFMSEDDLERVVSAVRAFFCK